MSRPRRYCSVTRCRNLVTSGKCAVHQGEKVQRDSSTYDSSWRRLSRWHRQQFPLCGQGPNEDANRAASRCLQLGLITLADVSDHIVPVTVDPARRLDPTNLRSLCANCHNSLTLNGLP